MLDEIEPRAPVFIPRRLMLLHRLAAESGHSIARIIAHVAGCDVRQALLERCDRYLYARVEDIHWPLHSAMLFRDIGEAERPCRDCRSSCPRAG